MHRRRTDAARSRTAGLLLLALAACSGSTPLVDRVEAARVSADGRTLTVTVTHGVCEDGTRRATVTEPDEQVRVRVDGARVLDGACVGMGTESTADLDERLGDSALVDASTGERVHLP